MSAWPDGWAGGFRDPLCMTPWELRDGLWYKREDFHRNDYGVNGAKYRAARHMMKRAKDDGFTQVVSAQSVLSPQSSITATLAEELGMDCTLVYGASKPETAVRHPNVRIAAETGAHMDFTQRVAYNGVIQPYADRLAEVTGAWRMPYAISPAKDCTPDELRDFLSVGGAQVRNLPPEVETIVIAFGSGNTTASMLYGLITHGRRDVERVILIGVGPDRVTWLQDTLVKAGAALGLGSLVIEHRPLHGWFANYGDRMPETSDGIVMHPTYEGKAIRYLNTEAPAGLRHLWQKRDASVGFWIVGGPL